MHPHGIAYDGFVFMIKKTLCHYEANKQHICKQQVYIEENKDNINLTAVY